MGATPADVRSEEYGRSRDELAELRALLLGQQIVELQALQKRLDDRALRSEELSQVLAQAVAISIKRDRGLQRSLFPVVTEALKIAIAKNPALLATALAPIIGDAVRKAVANAFRNVTESINFVLERSLSWESVKWRIEALRTGRSFGEIALLRSLRYKVQQVILIHSETGSVLQQANAPGAGIKQAELASSMLTALQDYIRDISERPSQDLQEIKMDDSVYWVHHGPQALLLGQISGTPPPELRNVFARENELIHREFAAALAAFNGDASLLDGARPRLQNCLLGQTDQPRKPSRWWVAALAALLLGLAAVSVLVYQRNSRWNRYLARLRNEPGMVVTGGEKSWRQYSVSGLRDPFAADPGKLAADFGIAADKLHLHFEPYESLDPRFVQERELASARQRLEEQMISFPVNSSVLTPDQGIRLDEIERDLLKLEQFAGTMGRQIHVDLLGRADQTGADGKNAALSKERAERVRDALRERGFGAEMMTATGLGSSEPLRHGSAAYQLEVNRSVTLKVQENQGDTQ